MKAYSQLPQVGETTDESNLMRMYTLALSALPHVEFRVVFGGKADMLVCVANVCF